MDRDEKEIEEKETRRREEGERKLRVELSAQRKRTLILAIHNCPYKAPDLSAQILYMLNLRSLQFHETYATSSLVVADLQVTENQN